MDEAKCRSQGKQWLAALAAILPMMVVGFLGMLVNNSLRGPIVTITIVGCVIGTISGAVSADVFGRKSTLLMTMICMAAGIIGTFLPKPDSCPVIPLIGGINAGIACTVVPLYISEIAEDKIRGRLLMLQVAGIYLGQFVMITIGSIGSMTGRIVMNVLLIVIPIIFLISIYWFPESPYYLASKKQHEAAAKSLAFFRGIDGVTAGEEVQVVVNYVEENGTQKGICQKVLEIFRGNSSKGLVIVALLIIVQWDRMFVYNSEDLAYSLHSILPIRFEHSKMIISATLLIWSGILVFTIDTVGRRRYLLGSTLVGFAIASSAAVIDFASGLRIFSGVVIMDRIDTLVVAKIFLHLCQMVIFGVPFVFIGELFPTNIRSVASSMAVIFGIIVKGIFLLIDQSIPGGARYDFWVFIPVYLLAFLFILAFVPETKKNSFSEIQNGLADVRLKCGRGTSSQYNQLIDSK